MKKKRSLLYLIIAFVMAQFAWMGLLGVWIYWYVSNYMIFKQAGDKLRPEIILDAPNVALFSGGIVLIVCIAIVMSLIFRNFSVQIKLTRLYDNFLANVTHELKSPLSAIQLYLETIYNKDVPPEKRKQFVEMMLKDVDRLKNRINVILKVLRLEQKPLIHEYELCQAGQVIPRLIKQSAESFRLTDNRLKVEGCLSCKCVLDTEGLLVVFNNLIDNAIRYSIDSVKLTIKLSQTRKWVTMEFKDKGIGINPKDYKRIFAKFERLHNRNSPNVIGTGLGLYYVREIVRLHGGRVTVNSEGLNKGANFKIEIPVYGAVRKWRLNRLLKHTAAKKELIENSNGNE